MELLNFILHTYLILDTTVVCYPDAAELKGNAMKQDV
jgi:hypothetical protein